jgi:hypothetical protein
MTYPEAYARLNDAARSGAYVVFYADLLAVYRKQNLPLTSMHLSDDTKSIIITFQHGRRTVRVFTDNQGKEFAVKMEDANSPQPSAEFIKAFLVSDDWQNEG